MTAKLIPPFKTNTRINFSWELCPNRQPQLVIEYCGVGGQGAGKREDVKALISD